MKVLGPLPSPLADTLLTHHVILYDKPKERGQGRLSNIDGQVFILVQLGILVCIPPQNDFFFFVIVSGC